MSENQFRAREAIGHLLDELTDEVTSLSEGEAREENLQRGSKAATWNARCILNDALDRVPMRAGKSPAKYDEFVIAAINSRDTEGLLRLAEVHGDGPLIDGQTYERSCADHGGVLVRATGGEIVGACLVNTQDLPLIRGAGRLGEIQRVTYLHGLVVHAAYRNRGLATLIAHCCIAFEYGRTDGPFPDVVAVSFADASVANKAQRAIGMVPFARGAFEVEIHPALRAVSELVWKDGAQRSDGDPYLHLLDQAGLPEIARQVAATMVGGHVDHEHRTIVRFMDQSEGRSGIVDAIVALANGNPLMLARIGLNGDRNIRAVGA